MKKVWKTVLVLALAALCLTAVAAAADAPASGICDVTPQNGATLTPKDAQGNPVNAAAPAPAGTTNFYPGAEKVGLSYNVGVDASAYYLVLVLEGDSDTPTASNVVYVDQETGTVSFDIYPSALKSSETYHIKLSSNASSGVTTLTEMGTFSYYAAYTLGDVDENGKINSNDASCALQIAVGRGTWTENQRLAANADKSADGKVTAQDAQWILEAAVGKRVL